MKTELIMTRILTLPIDNSDYVIDTDASGLTIEAVLSQIQDEREKVIAYASKLLCPAKRSYCVIRCELLAVIYYLKYFRQYLLGRKFTIRTDHAALRWLRRNPVPIGQNARLLQLHEEYNVDIIH